jgi:hypothetical protein
MKPEAQELYKLARTLHQNTVVTLMKLAEDVKVCTDEKECADLSYALAEIIKLTDDVKKRCGKVRRISDQMACALTLMAGSAETIRTEYCSATPKVTTILSVPKRKGDPGYGALMDHLGVPRHLYDDSSEHGVVGLHWMGVVTYLGEQQAAGKPLPPGIDPNKTYPQYAIHIRGKQSPAGDATYKADENEKDEEVPF